MLFSQRIIVIAVTFLIILAALSFLLLRWFGGDFSFSEWFKSFSGSNRKEVLMNGENIIRYTASGFSHAGVSVEEGRGLGCLVTIINETMNPLTIRVGPYEEGKEKGVSYPTVEPGGSLKFDPRYSGYTELPFYVKENPDHQFKVIFESTCQ